MVDAGRKQLENLLQQLNEQLLINVSQQSHLSSSPGGAKQIARFVFYKNLCVQIRISRADSFRPLSW